MCFRQPARSPSHHLDARFARRNEIKNNENCIAGCAGGTGICPPNWYPGGADLCSPDCGRIYESFCERPPCPIPNMHTCTSPRFARSPSARSL